MASEELTIEASVIEAVAEAMEIQADGRLNLNRKSYEQLAEAAIRAAFEATGMKVEHKSIVRNSGAFYKRWRYSSDWHPVEQDR